jgi:hypothetical protein
MSSASTRMLPSSTASTFSATPISGTVAVRVPNANEDVRAATRKPRTLANEWMTSSLNPGASQALLTSALKYSNGSTATELAVAGAVTASSSPSGLASCHQAPNATTAAATAPRATSSPPARAVSGRGALAGGVAAAAGGSLAGSGGRTGSTGASRR